MSLALSGPRKASYVLVGVGFLLIVKLNLAPALLAGLAAYMILDQSNKALVRAGARPLVARWGALGVLLVFGLTLGLIFEAFLRIGMSRLPLLLERAAPRVDAIGARFGLELPLDTPADARRVVMDWVRHNAREIGEASGLVTRSVFQMIIAIVAGTLFFLSPGDPIRERRDLHSELMDECSSRLSLFVASFERVVGAQVLIASINAAATAVFLHAVDMPFKNFLILATFVCGLVPIVGNVASNILICAAALVRSDELAIASLIFLVLIHKGEYFLNSRIVGPNIAIPLWATLLGLIAGEILMGMPGVILAPALLFYLRAELRRASDT